jgi:hypothetical protein
VDGDSVPHPGSKTTNHQVFRTNLDFLGHHGVDGEVLDDLAWDSGDDEH